LLREAGLANRILDFKGRNCVNGGYFKKDAIKKILGDHTAGKTNNGARIWSLLFLELWHREFIDKEHRA